MKDIFVSILIVFVFIIAGLAVGVGLILFAAHMSDRFEPKTAQTSETSQISSEYMELCEEAVVLSSFLYLKTGDEKYIEDTNKVMVRMLNAYSSLPEDVREVGKMKIVFSLKILKYLQDAYGCESAGRIYESIVTGPARVGLGLK